MGAVAGQYSAGLIVVPDHSMAAVEGRDVVHDQNVRGVVLDHDPRERVVDDSVVGDDHVTGGYLDLRVRIGVVAPTWIPNPSGWW